MKSQNLSTKISKILSKKRIFTDDLSLIAYAADAGCYRKVPKVVVKPANESELIALIKLLKREKTGFTFRAAGTSLSGQAISDSILIQARGDDWSKTEVFEGGKRVKTQIGITGTRLNQILKPYGTKFGPDPASINSALIGGIIANNASGMSCGTHANSYATIEAARIILPDGTLLVTDDEESRSAFLHSKANLVKEILRLRDYILSKPELVNKIRSKYSIKNTTGYGLNSFLDYTDPIDIILHLMVGSEGTLGFVSEATFRTIPELPFRASAMIYFASLKDACDAVPRLKEARVSAIELIDREALRSVENQAGIPEFIKAFGKGATALLIDLEAESADGLEQLIESSGKALSEFALLQPFEITKDKKQILSYWKIRKGVFPSVGGMRKPGTSVIIEDIAVKMEHLTPAVLDIRHMLDALGYDDAVIYGHALDGNLHFIFAQDFNDSKELERYENLIEELVKLIVDKYDGSLKAEHGTGMNMAPFVEYEWGKELYSVMCDIKKAIDPEMLLNPDVIITNDRKLYLKNFKLLPLVDDTVDKCIECGFCEINCLSTGYTLSARQRIVVQRELHRIEKTEQNRHERISRQFNFSGNESCAGDGLCALTCPLSIDTGVFIKKIRNKRNAENRRAQKLAMRIAVHFDTTITLVRSGLGMVTVLQKLMGEKVLGAAARFVRWLSGNLVPAWNAYLPTKAKIKKVKPTASENDKPTVVYFPSCINQSMGPAAGDADKKPLVQVTIEVLERAGYRVVFPENMSQLCCGTPWESKGFMDIANQKSSELEAALMKATQNGKHMVLCDTSPCIYRMRKVMDKSLKMFEPVEFIHDYLLDRMDIKKVNEKVAVHITCSSTKMNLQEKFEKVVGVCVDDMVIPQEVGCCGFAGDKGFSQPELNDWALRKLKAQVSSCQTGYSNSRTCEIGLSKNSGIDYKSIMYLLDKATK